MSRRKNAVVQGSAIAWCLCGLLFSTQAIHAATTEKWVTLSQLTEPTPAASSRFGEAVSMSDNYLVVGAPGTSSGAGTVYVFTRTGNAWLLSDTLHAPSWQLQAGAHFGATLAVSGDNLVVGEPDYDDTAIGSGSVCFYRRNAVTGKFALAFDTGYAQTGGHFGYSVAVSATQALIGAPGVALAGSPANAGAVFVWQYSQNAWSSMPAFTASPAGNGAGFGSSLALFEPSTGTAATTFAAGAPGYGPSGANDLGEVFVFTFGAGGWAQSQRLHEQSEIQGDGFGTSVAITADRVFGGSIARDNPGGATMSGSVTSFYGSPGSFAYEDELFSISGSSNAQFGQSMSLYVDGNAPHLFVGAPFANQGASVADSGAAYVFLPQATPGAWAQQDRLSLGSDAVASDHLASSVSTFGLYVAVGAPQREVGTTTNAGVVEIFIKDTIFADGLQ
ncbi:hypothetical protein ELE36_18010 [Pseudolysobacter antarcticus]|uniref:Integrin n=1 Tax=Pseudolysobacter antarcticus TaxID=2511995 RepID=A0A411HNX1_9GAMM|nr:FG-GAP repeat protein [Pseudolysobacter antarcticus]QBB72110.1 hypothetical protein ELE36_18010 [Pseudolysobacter antarcticus]